MVIVVPMAPVAADTANHEHDQDQEAGDGDDASRAHGANRDARKSSVRCQARRAAASS